jgi:hypothetical protein
VLSDDPRNGVSALNRLTRDVLVRRGLKHVILLEGVNDLRTVGHTFPAEDIIAGYQKIIDRVHAKKGKIYGADADADRGLGPVHAGHGGRAAEAEHVDPHQPEVRRRDRLYRPGHPRPGAPAAVPDRVRQTATTCTPTRPGTGRWARRST